MALPLLAAGALSLGSSLFGSRSARRAAQRAEAQARERQAAIQQYGRDALGRSQQYTAGLEEAGAFRPWNIRTGMGGWNIDPATGQATAEMGPEAKAFQDWAYGQSQAAQQQLSQFDRQGFANQEFQRAQELLNPQRQQVTSNTLGMLNRKGLAGFGITGAGGGPATNPIMSSLMDRFNRQDLELADRSFAAADTQMDRLNRQATGMFGQGYGLNDDLMNQLELNMRYGAADRDMAMQNWANRGRIGAGQEDLYRLAALGGMEDVANAQNQSNQARLSRDMGLANAFNSIGSSFLPSIGGMFSGGARPFNEYWNR